MNGLTPLTIELLKVEAGKYGAVLSTTPIPELYGVNDGKTVGTYVEQAFQETLASGYELVVGNAALGIDLPSLGVDLKVTSISQPQSSSPFRDATQKVYGLGYHLLVFVYSKVDDHAAAAASLTIEHVVFIDQARTGDYQTTYGVREILGRNGNVDDLDAFFQERNLPLDDIGRRALADRVMVEEPLQGALTISNALQWRLQYGRAIVYSRSDDLPGVEALLT
jgi:restriction system protein